MLSLNYNERNNQKIKNLNKKESLKSYLENFFEEFYSSIGSDDSELNLYDKFLTEFEKPVIIKTLKYCNGNQMKASKMLGINRNTLRTKISKYKIPNKFGKK